MVSNPLSNPPRYLVDNKNGKQSRRRKKIRRSQIVQKDKLSKIPLEKTRNSLRSVSKLPRHGERHRNLPKNRSIPRIPSLQSI